MEFFQNSLKFVAEIDKNVTEAIKEGECSDVIGYVKNVFQITTDEWKSNSKLDLGKKWWDRFGFLKNENISFGNLLPLGWFPLALPGTNAEVERVFSVMNALWTNEKNWFKAGSVGVLLIMSHVQEVSRTDFHSLIK